MNYYFPTLLYYECVQLPSEQIRWRDNFDVLNSIDRAVPIVKFIENLIWEIIKVSISNFHKRQYKQYQFEENAMEWSVKYWDSASSAHSCSGGRSTHPLSFQFSHNKRAVTAIIKWRRCVHKSANLHHCIIHFHRNLILVFEETKPNREKQHIAAVISIGLWNCSNRIYTEHTVRSWKVVFPWSGNFFSFSFVCCCRCCLLLSLKLRSWLTRNDSVGNKRYFGVSWNVESLSQWPYQRITSNWREVAFCQAHQEVVSSALLFLL